MNTNSNYLDIEQLHKKLEHSIIYGVGGRRTGTTYLNLTLFLQVFMLSESESGVVFVARGQHKHNLVRDLYRIATSLGYKSRVCTMSKLMVNLRVIDFLSINEDNIRETDTSKYWTIDHYDFEYLEDKDTPMHEFYRCMNLIERLKSRNNNYFYIQPKY